ncbi:hypothetical protein IMSAGC009_00807 [Lachnospiraceae bacterium]|nr:hypothetical protein D7V90_01515 [bacterium 1xD42-87]GFI15648.1 hypothetical protein IMSAGC009_00807 [Lachnospiraceae bacterium]
MNEIEKVRRCKSCGKLLIDEKTFCRRCKLKMRNTGGKVGGIISSLIVAFSCANSLANDREGKNGASSSD